MGVGKGAGSGTGWVSNWSCRALFWACRAWTVSVSCWTCASRAAKSTAGRTGSDGAAGVGAGGALGGIVVVRSGDVSVQRQVGMSKIEGGKGSGGVRGESPKVENV
jgi:hypothetical protein